MKAWLASIETLSPRRQLALAAALAAAGLLLFLVLVRAPLAQRLEEAGRAHASAGEELRAVRAYAEEYRRLAAAGTGAAASQGESLNAAVTASLETAGLQLSRIQQNGDGGLQLRLDDVPFPDALAWLHELETTRGLTLAELNLSPAGAAGRVNLSLLLRR